MAISTCIAAGGAWLASYILHSADTYIYMMYLLIFIFGDVVWYCISSIIIIPHQFFFFFFLIRSSLHLFVLVCVFLYYVVIMLNS